MKANKVDKTEFSKDEFDKQREMAFKIMYFFLSFIILTFMMLYVYYKLDQKHMLEDERKKKAKGIFYS